MHRVAILGAGFFVAGREGGEVSRLRDPMCEKGIPFSPPIKSTPSWGVFYWQNNGGIRSRE